MWLWLKRGVIGLFLLSMGAVGGVIGLYYWLKPTLPDIAQLKDVQLETPMKIFSREGYLISQFGEKRRIPLELHQIPTRFIDAFLATEDARFYQHIGIDPIGILRAMFVWVTSGQAKQGASTITQQVARNFFLSREKTIIRKVKEIFLAWHIEQVLSKDEILALYLNKIPLGQRAFGVGAAAQVYYGKDVSELSIAEMATIAGLPKAPSVLNPISFPERAKERRAVVLARMLDTQKIAPQEYQHALSSPIETTYHGAEIDLYAPYLAEMARQYVLERYGEQAYTQGLQIFTTVSAKRQQAAQQAVVNGLLAYDMRHGYRGPEHTFWQADHQPLPQQAIKDYLEQQQSLSGLLPAVVTDIEEKSLQCMLADGQTVTIEWAGLRWARPFIDDNRQGSEPDTVSDILKIGDVIRVRQTDKATWQLAQLPDANAALISLDPTDGAIEALVGGFNFQLSKFNRVNQAKRLVGSTIKPFIYATAFENGYTLASLVDDAPINEWDPSQGIAWRPKNSTAVYHGPTRLREGLARSKNVMTVRLLRQVGLSEVAHMLTKFNIAKEEIPMNESLSLGAIALTPLQLTRGFSAFANGGFLIEPYFISHIDNNQGTRIFTTVPQKACVDCPEPVYQDEFCMSEETHPCDDMDIRYSLPATQVMSEQTAFLVSDALRSAIWGDGSWEHGTAWLGTGWRTARALKRHDISGKTGTTNDARDAWFVGYNPELLTTVWIGFDDYLRELGYTRKNANLENEKQIVGGEFGSNTAQPIWIDYNKVVLADTPERATNLPPEIVSVRIDRQTGLLTRKSDHTTRFEYFRLDTQPTRYANPQTQALGEFTGIIDELF